MDQFLLARFFQGMGLCFISVIGYATLQEIFSEMDAVRLIAFMANISTSAPLIGPLLGAVFIQHASWRYIFVWIAVLAFITWCGLWRFMPESVGQMKTDGERIERVSLSPRTIAHNYINLMRNSGFMSGCFALSCLGLPCIAWVGLSPVILVASAHLSIIEYGLWQIPVFAAAILGNLLLAKLTYHCTLERIIVIGSCVMGLGLILMPLFVIVLQGSFIGLMPGLIVYFFGLGITHGPLTRLTLFTTPIAKGTASAMMTMLGMLTQALGIEVANRLYATHLNVRFGLFCTGVGMLYVLTCSGAFFRRNKDVDRRGR
jgi:DHA1 family multidrug/chloramphenicol efflux transport protein-like MFS transporter